jgi:hypothetical protein
MPEAQYSKKVLGKRIGGNRHDNEGDKRRLCAFAGDLLLDSGR